MFFVTFGSYAQSISKQVIGTAGKTQTNSLLMNNSKNLLFTISNWQKQTFPTSISIPSRSPDLMTGHIVTHHSGKNDL